jgi:hypothetical protein
MDREAEKLLNDALQEIWDTMLRSRYWLLCCTGAVMSGAGAVLSGAGAGAGAVNYIGFPGGRVREGRHGRRCPSPPAR